MSSEFDDIEESSEVDNDEVPWEDIVFHEPQQEPSHSLDMTDYLALFIASLQTIFLPVVVLIVVFLVIGFGFTILF